MGTYFHGNSEIQADGLQTLFLMNPAAYVNYSDTSQHQHQHQHQHQNHQQNPSSSNNNNFVFLNPSGTGNNGGYSIASPQHSPHAPPQQQRTQHFVGIPLQTNLSGPSQDQTHHEISTLQGYMPRVQYNLWNPIDQSVTARDVPRSQQGLSLSLSSQHPGFGSFKSERELPSPAHQQPAISSASGEEMRVFAGSPSSASGISNGISGIQSVLFSSKYLKVAQQVLDEVVNVVDGLNADTSKKSSTSHSKLVGDSSVAEDASIAGETTAKQPADLTTAERQEIQMKKSKLVSMLDEVEQRYRQYHHQMQIVISSFEQAAGIGSAKTYTALALQTISKQFRCLKDAILGQIRAANKLLGEEDCLGGKMEGSSRLKFVDHQLRQQRALQQLGMIQHNAWRPQRGLPERSVSVLRAWLFEHFLHPYPKDSDKHMLAKQTGLTRSQVSNWFINARVRLWKPMVEEMYLEEVKENEQNGSEDNRTSKSEQNDDSGSKSSAVQEKRHVLDHNNNFKSKQDDSPMHTNVSTISPSTATNSPMHGNLVNHTGFSLIGSSELDGITNGSPKKQRSAEMMQCLSNVSSMHMDMKPSEANNEQILMKFGVERQARNGYSLMGGPTNFIGGFGSYPIDEIGRFDTEHYQPTRFSNNAVSLSLGQPDTENLSSSGAHQPFFPNQNIQLGRRVELGEANELDAMNSPTPAYDNMNIQTRKRFAAQLLPDFVA